MLSTTSALSHSQSPWAGLSLDCETAEKLTVEADVPLKTVVTL